MEDEYGTLLNKPYENEGTSREQTDIKNPTSPLN